MYSSISGKNLWISCIKMFHQRRMGRRSELAATTRRIKLNEKNESKVAPHYWFSHNCNRINIFPIKFNENFSLFAEYSIIVGRGSRVESKANWAVEDEKWATQKVVKIVINTLPIKPSSTCQHRSIQINWNIFLLLLNLIKLNLRVDEQFEWADGADTNPSLQFVISGETWKWLELGRMSRSMFPSLWMLNGLN